MLYSILYIAKKGNSRKKEEINVFFITKIFYDNEMNIMEKKEWKFFAVHKNSEAEIIENIIWQEQFREEGKI